MNTAKTHPKVNEEAAANRGRNTTSSKGSIVDERNCDSSKGITSSANGVPERNRQRTTSEWAAKINPFAKSSVPPVPEERMVSREHSAGLISKLYFQWMSPLLSVGYQRSLELNDIWAVNPDRRVDVMVPKFKAALKRRTSKPGRLDPLLMALFDTFKQEFIIGGACQLCTACLQVLVPFTLRYLITFASDAYTARMEGTAAPPIGHGIGIVIGILCMQMVQSLCTSHAMYRGMMVGGQARSTLIACVFEKAIKLSGRARVGGTDEQLPISGDENGWSNSRINNVMSTDTSRIDLAAGSIHRCWTAPIQILLTLPLLCINLTYSALAGFAFVCLAVPLLGSMIKVLMSRRKAINQITDRRIRLLQEVISSIRFVKVFGWEKSFLDRLQTIRQLEIWKIYELITIRNGILAILAVTPIFASILTFMTYGLSNHALRAAPVFSSLALFNALSAPLEWLPVAIGQAVDASASIGRISRFLSAEEQQDEAVMVPGAKDAISLAHATFTWEQSAPTASPSTEKATPPTKGSIPAAEQESAVPARQSQPSKDTLQVTPEEHAHAITRTPASPTPSSHSIINDKRMPFKIHDVDLSIGRHEFIAVIGSVGSGKSSLLSALAGEMRCTAGSVTFGASRAFCSQYAWIQNATVRQNILFGREIDQDRYDAVIDACALRPDLNMLPSGDLTEIGERGITISGGQKQRLNIARAIYFDADIVLMDDPLSAVDAHVGKHIVDHAMCGLLRNKCRILATHQLHVLRRVDRIIWMKSGSIYRVATFADLIGNDTEFQGLMEKSIHEEEESVQTDEQIQGGNTALKGEQDPPQPTNDSKPLPATLMQQEERAVRSVSFGVYRDYIQASGSILNSLLVFVTLAVAQGVSIVTGLWLSWWTSDRFQLSTGQYIGTYAALGALQSLLLLAFASILTYFCTKSSRVMLHCAVSSVLQAPMSFFDTTPLGRIINRFSKDVDVMDNSLVDSQRFFLFLVSSTTAVFCLAIAYYHYFAIVLAPLAGVLIFAAAYYRASAREIKRHEAVLRSVVFSRFSEAVIGTSTIRAYQVQNHFSRSLIQSLDSMDGAYFLSFANQRLLATRLDTFGNLLMFVVGILVVTSRFNVSPSIAGLVLSYMVSLIQTIQLLVRQFADVENNMNATERIHYYGKSLEQEALSRSENLSPSWPHRGEITFSDVQMRYREGLPLVLKGMNLRIQSGERIGIVGRTGAGKSSIATVLFRLVELTSGAISIDGINIATVGLQDLRSRLAIIPQDPTLFRGTLRSNLDPFGEHHDTKLWHAIRQADLVNATADEGARVHLDSNVEDEGLNFSSGQRQLIALARALVRDSQIIVCDEATSSVDLETDQKIQRMILEAFEDKTLLCIAHRLNTVIGYDRIVVMDQGDIAELGRPIELYDNGGIFRGMCERSGIGREEVLSSSKKLP